MHTLAWTMLTAGMLGNQVCSLRDDDVIRHLAGYGEAVGLAKLLCCSSRQAARSHWSLLPHITTQHPFFFPHRSSSSSVKAVSLGSNSRTWGRFRPHHQTQPHASEH